MKRNKAKKRNTESELPVMEDVNWEEIEKNFEVNDVATPSCSNNVSRPTESPTVVTNSILGINSPIMKPDVKTRSAAQKPDGGFKLL